MHVRCRFVYLMLALLLAGGPGCGFRSLREQREDRDPLLRRAREKNNAKDIEGAIEAYKRVIDKRPTLARAHLELALIYDEHVEDYVRAVYHFERFLELRPDAGQRDLVREMIQRARIMYAASLPDQPSEAVRLIRLLREENAALRAQVQALTSAPRAPRAAAPEPQPQAAAVAAPLPSPSPPAVPAPAAVTRSTTYTVQPGDTLARIAGRVYGDSKRWQPIYEANRAALPGGPQSIRAGQVLIIPTQDR